MRTMDDDHGDWLHEVARDKRLDTLAADEDEQKSEHCEAPVITHSLSRCSEIISEE